MKLYQEHKVNPFASCLPLLAQLPVFIALFYLLQDDLRVRDLRQTEEPLPATRCRAAPSAESEFLFIPDITDNATGGVLIALIVLYVGSQLAVVAADERLGRQEPADDLPGAAVHLHPVRHQLPGGPARLLDHDERLDDRAAVHRPADRRAGAAGACNRRGGKGDDDDGGKRGEPRRRALAEARSAAAAAERHAPVERAAAAAVEAQEEAIRETPLDGRAARRRGRCRRCSSASPTRSTSTPPSRSPTTARRSPASVEGSDVGLFIGHHGQTIEAVQHLAQRIAGDVAPRRAPADRRRRRRLPRAPRERAPAPGRRGRRQGRRVRPPRGARRDDLQRAPDRARVPARPRRRRDAQRGQRARPASRRLARLAD